MSQAPSLAGREAPTHVGVRQGERKQLPSAPASLVGGVLVKSSLETGEKGLGGELKWGPGNNRNQFLF